MSGRVRRLVNLRVSTAQIRTAVYDDQEHLIVPVVVMKGDAVVRPLYSDGPEFVPASELALLPQSLDGRPIVPDHPLEGRSSANVPGILDKQSFGLAFNSKMSGNDLHCDAYINPSKANKVGDSAKLVVDKINAKEMVEISCGAYVTLEKCSGMSPSGIEYEYIWRDITFDHLAIGLNGSEGACSIEMGCGAPRVNKVTDTSNRKLRSTKDGDNVKGLAKRLKALLTGGQTGGDDNDDDIIAVRQLFVPSAAGLGNKELNNKLSTALFNAVPAYGWLWDSYSEDSTVIYTTYDAGDYNTRYWMRSYSVDNDDNVTIADDEQEMMFDESAAFQPKMAANRKSKSASCECQKNKVTRQEVTVMTMDATKKKELIARLLASAKIKALKYDEAKLTAMSDETLAELDAIESVKPVEEQPKPAEPVTAAPNAAPVAITEDQLPQSLRDRLAKADEIIAEREQARAARHAQLVVNLKEPAKDAYTEEQLKAMKVEELEGIEKLLKLNKPKTVDYSGQGFPKVDSGDDLQDFMPPDSYGLVAARKKKETTSVGGDGKEAN